MTARDRILQRIRAGLGRSPDDPVPAPPATRDAVAPAGPVAAEALVQRFLERLAAVGGQCRPATADTVAAVVVDALRQAKATTVALGALDAPLAGALRDAGFACLPPDADDGALFAAEAGVTAAQWAIAETGSIALDDAVARARRASLVPPLHIAVVARTRLLPDLDTLLAQLGRPVAHAVTLITGPSRTADIELQLVVGVHGPRELLVVLADR